MMFLDGYCSTVQGLLDWFEVDLGLTELLFIQIDLCVLCLLFREDTRPTPNTNSSASHMNASYHTCEWVMSHIWMCHVTHMNGSCHKWMSHVTHGADVRVISHMFMNHVTHLNDSCHAYEWVMSHVWMSNGTHVNKSHIANKNESCLTYDWVMSHMNESCHTWMSHATHETWRWSMWKSGGGRGLQSQYALRIRTCLTHKPVISHMNESCHTYERVMPHIWTSHATHMNESCHVQMRYIYTLHMRSSYHIWISPGASTCLHFTAIDTSMSHVMYECVIREEVYRTSTRLEFEPTSHVRCQGVMSRMNGSCCTRSHTWMRHVTHKRVMSLMNGSFQIWMCHVTYEWVMLHIWMSHVSCERVGTQANASYQMWMIQFTYSCHIWTRRVIHMNAFCHAYEYVMSHIWTCRVKHINASCRTCILTHASNIYTRIYTRMVMSHIFVRHILSHIFVRHIFVCHISS